MLAYNIIALAACTLMIGGIKYLDYIAEKFHWTKMSPSPATFALQKYFFCKCSEDHCRLYVIINNKVRGIKNSHMRAGS